MLKQDYPYHTAGLLNIQFLYESPNNSLPDSINKHYMITAVLQCFFDFLGNKRRFLIIFRKANHCRDFVLQLSLSIAEYTNRLIKVARGHIAQFIAQLQCATKRHCFCHRGLIDKLLRDKRGSSLLILK